MSDVLTEKFNLVPKRIKTASVASPPSEEGCASLNAQDIIDFVPIDNNADDFDLGTILNDVVSEEKSKPQLNIPSENAVVPAEQHPIIHQQFPQIGFAPVESNKTVNVAQANNFPLIPQMYFPGSTVTINYNITYAK